MTITFAWLGAVAFGWLAGLGIGVGWERRRLTRLQKEREAAIRKIWNGQLSRWREFNSAVEKTRPGMGA